MSGSLGQFFAETVIGGPLLLAFAVAMVAGLVSFASPCVLPLIPGYLGYLGGMSGQLGQSESSPDVAVGVVSHGRSEMPSSVQHGSRREVTRAQHEAVARSARAHGSGRLLAGVLLFVAGFSAVFVLMGVAFGWLGLALAPWLDVITRVMGVVVLLMGLSFLGYVPFLQRELRWRGAPRAGLWGAPALGVTFGLGWAPCMGPTLAAVLALSLDGGTPWRGATLALAYCLGLGVPFVVIAMAYHRASTVVGFLKRHHRTITRVGGFMLIALGLALISGLWTKVADWIGVWVGGFVTVV